MSYPMILPGALGRIAQIDFTAPRVKRQSPVGRCTTSRFILRKRERT
jgi:hypothetical protein